MPPPLPAPILWQELDDQHVEDAIAARNVAQHGCHKRQHEDPAVYTLTDVGTLWGQISEARGINDKGQVVGGSYANARLYWHAFLYSGSGMTDLGTLGGIHGNAQGINDSGQVVGYSKTGGGAYHAFLYSGSTMMDLGTLGGTYSEALDINNSGQVVGNAFLPGDASVHAFLYNGSTMIDLGTLGGPVSQANAINDYGQVVGTSYADEQAYLQHAFLYSGSVMTDLNTLIEPGSGWMLQQATGINDSGRSSASGCTTANRAPIC